VPTIKVGCQRAPLQRETEGPERVRESAREREKDREREKEKELRKRFATSCRGTSLIRKRPPLLGPPYGPRHSFAAGSYGKAFSYERVTPVHALILP
jgi:hypothetical protein